MWDLYVFDWFEATAALVGSKMCYQIIVRYLAPSRWYWPQKMAAILRVWNHIFALLAKSLLVIPIKLSRNIARRKGYLVRKFDLKWSWPRVMVAILRVRNLIFALLPKSILVIPMKLGRDIAMGKSHRVCEFYPNDLDLVKSHIKCGTYMCLIG